ncbi:MAG: lysophospholipid acyltransferase family protein [Bowdeniella nasicola]|nr:lysophospholipid acyltransferase family protein [Bowdeniella nasicola]
MNSARGQQVRAEEIYRWGPTWSRHIGRILDFGYYRTRVVGRERIPASGPLIVAANHVGIMDGPIVHGALPRGSHFIVKQEFFDSALGFLMTWAGQIPVDRSSGSAALRVALTLLDEGRVVGIFPEGTRGRGDVQTVHAGVAWLALRSGAPIVPTAVLGTRRPGDKRSHVPRFRAPLHVEFGEPIVPDVAGAKGRQATSLAMEQIGAGLAAHVKSVSRATGIALPER